MQHVESPTWPIQPRPSDLSPLQGRAIVDERYRIPADVCAARRSVSRACNATRREEWAGKKSLSAHGSSPLKDGRPRGA